MPEPMVASRRVRDADALGDVFEHAKDEGGQTGKQDGGDQGFDVCRRLAPGHDQANDDGHTADAGCGSGVELLDALHVVHGQGTVPALGQHQQHAQRKAGGHAPGCGLPGWCLENALECLKEVHGLM